MDEFDDGQEVATVAAPIKQIKQCKMRRERCHINKSTKELREEILLLSGIKQEVSLVLSGIKQIKSLKL